MMPLHSGLPLQAARGARSDHLSVSITSKDAAHLKELLSGWFKQHDME
jgi:hypothetical protein